jgi:hypothetical protein
MASRDLKSREKSGARSTRKPPMSAIDRELKKYFDGLAEDQKGPLRRPPKMSDDLVRLTTSNVKIGDRAEHMKKSVAGNISYNRMQELSVSTQKMTIDEDRKQELREKREKKLQVLVDFKAKAAAKREALIASKKR